MKWFVKIPSIELQKWAPSFTWVKLFQLWKNNHISGLIIPITLSDQLDGFVDRVQSLIKMAKKEGLASWIIIPVLNNSVYYYRYPQQRPSSRFEETPSLPNWFTPICPSDESYIDFFREQVSRLLNRLETDVVLLNYLNVPYFWEEWGNVIEADQYPPYCYCDRCKYRFELSTQKTVKEANLEEWLGWQNKLIVDLSQNIHKILAEIRKDIQIGAQLLPLLTKKKRDLYTQWVGQDIGNLQKQVHFFSPIVYNKLLNWSYDDLIFFLIELLHESRIPVIPSLQISSTKWDAGSNDETLTSLVNRLKPLGITNATLFHARDLLSEKAIKSLLK